MQDILTVIFKFRIAFDALLLFGDSERP